MTPHRSLESLLFSLCFIVLAAAGCTGARIELMNAESPATGPAGVAGSGGTGAAGSFGSGGTAGGTSMEAVHEAAGGNGGTTTPVPPSSQR
jgi:hypothetical protein